jgi:hypothetical protein
MELDNNVNEGTFRVFHCFIILYQTVKIGSDETDVIGWLYKINRANRAGRGRGVYQYSHKRAQRKATATTVWSELKPST